MTEELPIDPKTGKPYERRSSDLLMEKRLDKFEDAVNAKMRKFFTFLSVFVVAGTLVIGVIFYIQGNQSESIQSERFNGYKRTCEGQNARHDAAVKRAEINIRADRRKVTIDLIDALQPNLGDCQKYAQSRVSK